MDTKLVAELVRVSIIEAFIGIKNICSTIQCLDV